jgi:hypothetical protein
MLGNVLNMKHSVRQSSMSLTESTNVGYLGGAKISNKIMLRSMVIMIINGEKC